MDNEKIIAELQDIAAKIPNDDLGNGALQSALRRVKISLDELIARLSSRKVAKFHQRSRHKEI